MFALRLKCWCLLPLAVIKYDARQEFLSMETSEQESDVTFIQRWHRKIPFVVDWSNISGFVDRKNSVMPGVSLMSRTRFYYNLYNEGNERSCRKFYAAPWWWLSRASACGTHPLTCGETDITGRIKVNWNFASVLRKRPLFPFIGRDEQP